MKDRWKDTLPEFALPVTWTNAHYRRVVLGCLSEALFYCEAGEYDAMNVELAHTAGYIRHWRKSLYADQGERTTPWWPASTPMPWRIGYCIITLATGGPRLLVDSQRYLEGTLPVDNLRYVEGTLREIWKEQQ